MAGANFEVDPSGLDKLANLLQNPVLLGALNQMAGSKGVLALVSQAIADNFDKEGPGWKALKGETIRRSVATRMQKQLVRAASENAARKMGAVKRGKDGRSIIDKSKIKGRKAEFYEHVDKEIERFERSSRAGAKDDYTADLGARQILVRTNLLRATVTTPNPNTVFNEEGKTGANITRVEGNNLIYGTNLIYAGVHQYGEPKRNVPARPYLVIRAEWKARISRFVLNEAIRLIVKSGL